MSKSEVLSVHPVEVKVKTTKYFDFKACAALTLAPTKDGREKGHPDQSAGRSSRFFAD